jgi:DNA processing protein
MRGGKSVVSTGFPSRKMETCNYVGWIALALTPGLGPRLAGKLLREFGSPEAIFEASLTSLEAQHLPAAVAQAIHSRQPLSAAAKEIAQAEQLGCKCSRGMNLSTRGYCAKSTIRHPSCMSAETLNF